MALGLQLGYDKAVPNIQTEDKMSSNMHIFPQS